jgi:hypothetical protein
VAAYCTLVTARIGATSRSGYHFVDLPNIKGYEYYDALAKNINKHGIDAFVNFLTDLQIRGTPDQVYEQVMDHRSMVYAGGSIGVFSYGGMPHDAANANLGLFAEKVLPRLKAQDVGESIDGSGTPLTIAAA